MLDEILNGAPAAEQEASTAVQPPAETPAVEGAPAAPQEGQHVPLAALEAERKARQDHKGRADRAEGELAALREQLERQQPAAPADPLQSMQQQIINERFNTSEMLVRQAHPDVDDKVNAFMEAAKANPALNAALQSQRHPWQFAYNEGKRLLMLKEVGDDPSSYRAKIEAEVRAKVEAELRSQAPPVHIPASLNGARSVAPRSAHVWSGPSPLDAIVTR